MIGRNRSGPVEAKDLSAPIVLLIFVTANKYIGGGRVRAGKKRGRSTSVELLFATSVQCSFCGVDNHRDTESLKIEKCYCNFFRCPQYPLFHCMNTYTNPKDNISSLQVDKVNEA